MNTKPLHPVWTDSESLPIPLSPCPQDETHFWVRRGGGIQLIEPGQFSALRVKKTGARHHRAPVRD